MTNRCCREGAPCCHQCAEAKPPVLEKAMAAIMERQARYGDSTSHHKVTAQLWGAYLGREITPAEVAILMVLDKVARQRNDPTYLDNYVDMAGYADRAAHNAGVDE